VAKASGKRQGLAGGSRAGPPSQRLGDLKGEACGESQLNEETEGGRNDGIRAKETAVIQVPVLEEARECLLNRQEQRMQAQGKEEGA
jgi:hypothetical protein